MYRQFGAVGYRRTYAGFAELVLIDQLDMSVEEPPHLIAEAGLRSAAAAIDPQSSH